MNKQLIERDEKELEEFLEKLPEISNNFIEKIKIIKKILDRVCKKEYSDNKKKEEEIKKIKILIDNLKELSSELKTLHIIGQKDYFKIKNDLLNDRNVLYAISRALGKHDNEITNQNILPLWELSDNLTEDKQFKDTIELLRKSLKKHI